MLHFLLAINFVISFTVADVFTIGRISNRNDSHSTSDWIELSRSTCASVGQINLCRKLGSEIEVYWKETNYKNSCFCRCPLENATFGYYDHKWQCKNNEQVRKLLMPQDILFNKEKPSDSLSVLDYQQEKKFYLVKRLATAKACPSVTEVRYLRCNGAWSEPIEELKQVFSIDQQRRNVFQLKVNRPRSNNSLPLLSGKLLKLVLTFRCFAGTDKFRTLLMKFHGIQTCQEKFKFETTTNSPSLIITNLQVERTHRPTTTKTLCSPTTALRAPRDPSDTGKNTSSTSGLLIALAITGSLLLVVVVVFLLLKRWRGKRKDKAASRECPSRASSESEHKATEHCQLKKSLPRHEGLLNEAFLGDGFFRANQLAVGLSVGNSAAQLLGNEESRRMSEENMRKEDDGYFQPIHVPDDMSLDEYKQSLETNADEEIYTEAIDHSFQDSNMAGTRLRLTRIFEDSSGEIVIAIEDNGQTTDSLEETHFDQGTDSTVLHEQLYVNVSLRDDNNYDNYDYEINKEELGCYSSQEEEDNTSRPPVPKRSCSLENFDYGDESRSSTDSAPVMVEFMEKCEGEIPPLNGESFGDHFQLGLKDDENFRNQTELVSNEQRLFVQSNDGLGQQSEQIEMAYDVRENSPSASTNQLDETTRYGYGIPLPSPPPPSPPIRSLSLESLSQGDRLSNGEQKVDITSTDIRTNCPDVNMKGTSDDEGLYTYATSETIRNSLGVLDNTTTEYYDASCNRNSSSDVDDVCKMKPYGPTYAVLEPGETENCVSSLPSAEPCSSQTKSESQSMFDSDVDVYQALMQNGVEKYYTIQKPLSCP